MRSLRRSWGCALVFSLIAVAPGRDAWAAACCLSSSAFGVGRLAPFEDFAILANQSFSRYAGHWDGRATWHSASYSESEFRTQLSGIVALHQRLELSASMPWLVTTKSASGTDESGYGIGDTQVGFRFEPIGSGEISGVPGIALVGGMTMPSGRARSERNHPLATDITGRGAWVLSASVVLEVARMRWFVLGGAGVTYSFEQDTALAGHTAQLGRGFQATVLSGVEVVPKWIASMLAHYAYEGAVTSDGASFPGTQKHDAGVGPAVAFQWTPNWTVQAGFDTGIYVNNMGKNHDGRYTATLGVRYGYF
jgi:hypothetical protein